jgi:hypothetical protein
MDEQLIIITLIVIYLAATALNAVLAINKDASAALAVVGSLLLTPIFGYIYVSAHRKNGIYHVYQYKCKKCGFHFTEPHSNCPICLQKGVKSPLKKIVKEMT